MLSTESKKKKKNLHQEHQKYKEDTKIIQIKSGNMKVLGAGMVLDFSNHNIRSQKQASKQTKALEILNKNCLQVKFSTESNTRAW